MAKGELHGLLWSGVDRDAGTVSIPTSKNDQSRTILIDAELDGTTDHRKAAGCPGRVFHDLRRSPVRDVVRAEVLETVSTSISGHKTAAMFRRYDTTSAHDKADALAATAPSGGESDSSK